MFVKDLKYGVMGEKEIIELLCKNKENPTIEHKSDKKCHDWDFIIDGVSYEVKTDRMACRSNNIAVEVACNHKPSGVVISKADYWVFNLEAMDFIIIVPTEDLKELIRNVKKIKGGDRWKSSLHLLPIENIPKRFKYPRNETIVLDKPTD